MELKPKLLWKTHQECWYCCPNAAFVIAAAMLSHMGRGIGLYRFHCDHEAFEKPRLLAGRLQRFFSQEFTLVSVTRLTERWTSCNAYLRLRELAVFEICSNAVTVNRAGPLV